MGNTVPAEGVMGTNGNNMENYGDLQPIARNMKLQLWVMDENLSSSLLSYSRVLFSFSERTPHAGFYGFTVYKRITSKVYQFCDSRMVYRTILHFARNFLHQFLHHFNIMS